MGKIMIAFLGTGNSSVPIRYQFHDEIYEGHVFPEVLHQFVDFDNLYIFATEKARNTNWCWMENLEDQRIHCVDIPMGQNEEEMWEIFQKVTGVVHNDDTVIFDVTHGLRSIPFLTFLFAAFLRFARGVKIGAIYYGALELSRQPDGSTVPAPILDLSPFIRMFDWIAATDQFIQTGDARRVSQQLAQVDDRNVLAPVLTGISQAIAWCQPFTLAQEINALPAALSAPMDKLQFLPIQVLSERIRQSYDHFTMEKNSDHARLKLEYRLIEWYFDHGQLIQSLTLSREWLVDGATWRVGRSFCCERKDREDMENAVHWLNRIGKPGKNGIVLRPENASPAGQALWNLEEREVLALAWKNTTGLRNRLDHAQHQSDSLSLSEMEERSLEVRNLLNHLAIVWHCVDIDE